jgi:hypothetical protein
MKMRPYFLPDRNVYIPFNAVDNHLFLSKLSIAYTFYLYIKQELNCVTCCLLLKPLKMPKNKRLWTKVILAIVGAVGGFVYWKLIGCNSGTCPIQSKWYLSMLWGFAFGYLIGDLAGGFIYRRAGENE